MSANLDIEKIKSSKSSSDIIADIFYYCVTGEKINSDDLERFTWHGIYAKDEQQSAFCIKIPLSLGELNIEQLKGFEELLIEFNIENLSFKEGQKIIIDNLDIYNLPKIFNKLKNLGLSSFFESGHTIKKVITCPVNGLDRTQIFDVEELAKKINDTFIGNKNFFNLPNSLQFAISGYREGCDAGFTPDISFNAIKDSNDKVLFELKILQTSIGQIRASQIVATAKAIANIYKDFGQRENINSSNFESFIEDFELANFTNLLSSMLDFKIQNSIIINTNIEPKKPRMGINLSKVDGFSYIGFKSKSAELSQKELNIFIKNLEENGASKIKITHKSNIIILDVPSKNSDILVSNLENIGLYI